MFDVGLALAHNGPHDQGWEQVGLLAAAAALSAIIGFEREWRSKSAGLRTHAIVGVASALFVEVSKFGFGDVIGDGVQLDPSRVAAQIVTGVGFLGAGLIFVRRDAVRGLTTAAAIWLSAAVGAACGAGLLVLAATVTGLHLAMVFGFSALEHALARHRGTPTGPRPGGPAVGGDRDVTRIVQQEAGAARASDDEPDDED